MTIIPVPAGTHPGMPAGSAGIADCEAVGMAVGGEAALSVWGSWRYVATVAIGSGSTAPVCTAVVRATVGAEVTPCPDVPELS